VALTSWSDLPSSLAPLAFFAVLSFVIKRTGVHVAPEMNQSLVSLVDVAALFLFGPTLGAWVPVLSGSVYLVLNAWRRGPRNARSLVESPLFSAGSKAIMALTAGNIYLALGGVVPLREPMASLFLPLFASLVTWFALDNAFWAIWELFYRGWRELGILFRRTLNYTLLIELAPLPFSVLIAVAYSQFGGLHGPVFWLLAIALVGTAFVVQLFADARARLERRQRELQIMNEFGQEVAMAGLEEERILDCLIEYASRLARADQWQLELYDRDHKTIELYAVAAGQNEEHPKTHSPLGPIHRFFLEHRESLLARNLQTDNLPFEFSQTIAGTKPTAAMFAPVTASGETIALLSALCRRASLFPINQRNVDALCSATGVAVQNARSFAAERRKARQLEIISEVSHQVARFLDLDVLLRQTVEQLRERFGYTHVHLFMNDEENRGLVFRASTHPESNKWREEGFLVPLGQGIVGWVAALNEPILVSDVREDSRYVIGHPLLENTRSELAVPLTISGTVLGVLDVQSENIGAFDEEDLYTIKTLAAQFAIAIEDARLYAAQDEEKYYLNTLLQVAENLAATSSRADSLETVVRITPLLVGVERCVLFTYDEAVKAFAVGTSYGFTKEQQQALTGLAQSSSASPRAFLDLVERRSPVLITNSLDPEMLGDDLRKVFGTSPLLLVPLMARSQVTGVLAVDQGSRHRAFSSHEIQIIMGIANQAAVAIENARLNEEAEEGKRLEYELGLAQQIQASFLPESCPQPPGYEICAAWRVAREVGGDFYDFIQAPGGRVGLICADVSDKGIAAALFMALSRTLIRAMAIGKPSASEALERANDLILADTRSDMFVTAFYGLLDPLEHRVYYANAGHNPPIWYRRDLEEVTFLNTHGIALGVESQISLPERSMTMHQGDVLVIYTDGVTDAMNVYEQEFGTSRLADIVAAQADRSVDELIDTVLKELGEYTKGTEQFDDLTIVAVKRVD
jgi:serine phosphatase RsbU (regulator of sigma subunit)